MGLLSKITSNPILHIIHNTKELNKIFYGFEYKSIIKYFQIKNSDFVVGKFIVFNSKLF